MALTVTIASTARAIDEGSLSIVQVANGIDRLTCAVTSPDGSVTFDADEGVSVDFAGTTIFGGTVTTPSEAGFGGVGLTPITTMIDAQDYNAFTERCSVTATIPSGTLKAALVALAPYYTAYGITLDAAQADGPTLPTLIYDAKPLTDVFAELELNSGYLREVSASQVLGMYAPGTVVAPFNITDGDGNIDGDLQIIQRSRSGYANRVLVRAGSGQAWATQTWVANGTETSWVTDIPAAGPTSGYVTVGGIFKTLAADAGTKSYCYLGFVDYTVNVTDGDTITLGAQTYTFKTALTPTVNEVLIGATITETEANLINAINHGAGEGTAYATGTTANASVSAEFERPYRPWILIKALTVGTAGDSIVVSTTISTSIGGLFGEGGIVWPTLMGGADPAAAQYTWDVATHTLGLGTDPIPPAGTLIALSYLAQYPFTVQAPAASSEPTAEQTAHGLWEIVVTAPDVFDAARAQATADAELAKCLATAAREAKYTTYRDGLRTGMIQTINSATRHVNSSFIITQIQITDVGPLLRYVVTAIEGTAISGSFRDTYTGWGRSATVVAAASIGSGASGATPTYYLGGSRFHAVQVPA